MSILPCVRWASVTPRCSLPVAHFHFHGNGTNPFDRVLRLRDWKGRFLWDLSDNMIMLKIGQSVTDFFYAVYWGRCTFGDSKRIFYANRLSSLCGLIIRSALYWIYQSAVLWRLILLGSPCTHNGRTYQNGNKCVPGQEDINQTIIHPASSAAFQRHFRGFLKKRSVGNFDDCLLPISRFRDPRACVCGNQCRVSAHAHNFLRIPSGGKSWLASSEAIFTLQCLDSSSTNAVTIGSFTITVRPGYKGRGFVHEKLTM